MKKFMIAACSSLLFINAVHAQGSVVEGVITSATPIHSEVGEDGRPLLGAAVGVGLGSLFGSGGGKDAAMVAGGLLGAKRQAEKKKQLMYGWQYVIKGNDDQLHSVNSWCPTPNTECPGMVPGKEVYVVNGDQVTAK